MEYRWRFLFTSVSEGGPETGSRRSSVFALAILGSRVIRTPEVIRTEISSYAKCIIRFRLTHDLRGDRDVELISTRKYTVDHDPVAGKVKRRRIRSTGKDFSKGSFLRRTALL
jgi:hypothetical protein